VGGKAHRTKSEEGRMRDEKKKQPWKPSKASFLNSYSEIKSRYEEVVKNLTELQDEEETLEVLLFAFEQIIQSDEFK
jgi:hypothetical protein